MQIYRGRISRLARFSAVCVEAFWDGQNFRAMGLPLRVRLLILVGIVLIPTVGIVHWQAWENAEGHKKGRASRTFSKRPGRGCPTGGNRGLR